jgi:RNA polymerase sigma-70 factor (ECF subfamily)
LTFESLYKKYYNNIYNLSYRLTGNREDAEEVLQESFINAYKSWDNFKYESSPYTWLYRITINNALRFIKKRKRLPIYDLTEKHGISETDFFNSLKSFDNVENTVLEAEVYEYCMQMFINCMPKKQRITFTLRILLNLSVKETADIMGISENSVKINLFRAKQLLKENMEGRCSLINQKNPCSCNNWVNYFVKTGKNCTFPTTPSKHNNLKKLKSEIKTEISFINKVKLLYKNAYSIKSFDTFKTKIKKIMDEKSLKILS